MLDIPRIAEAPASEILLGRAGAAVHFRITVVAADGQTAGIKVPDEAHVDFINFVLHV